MDFSKPTPEMIEDAAKRGIDLTDNRVVEMLREMQVDKEKDGGGTGGKKDEREKVSRVKLHELVGELEREQLVAALVSMNEVRSERAVRTPVGVTTRHILIACFTIASRRVVTHYLC